LILTSDFFLLSIHDSLFTIHDLLTLCDIFFFMSTLAEIEIAAESLPPEQKEELIRFLAERLRKQRTVSSGQFRPAQSERGFPISKGREVFTSADVTRIDLETENT
jgi:hypothetical protein